ncbi:MAG: hypothetical protein UW30_C0021G0001 [Candidatus Giovannonibacteria bacterium GW2011_GWA2_44_13b]|nr:MAG: hypothetical protein UW30_C0021G0001 [Candidatus Giovannonibacteria bacterium GW2011_GWA2_44_13b]
MEKSQSQEEKVLKSEAQETKNEPKEDNRVLETRSREVDGKLQDLKKSLKSMEGTPGAQPIQNPDDPNRSEMRKLLDQQHKIESAVSPIDSTNPNRKTEYEDWARAIDSGKRDTQRLIQSLERRIGDTKVEIFKLEEEKAKLEKQIQG